VRTAGSWPRRGGARNSCSRAVTESDDCLHQIAKFQTLIGLFAGPRLAASDAPEPDAPTGIFAPA